MNLTTSIRSLLWTKVTLEGLAPKAISSLGLGVAALALAAVALALLVSDIEPGASQTGAASQPVNAAQGFQVDKPCPLSQTRTGQSQVIAPVGEYGAGIGGRVYLDQVYARSRAHEGRDSAATPRADFSVQEGAGRVYPDEAYARSRAHDGVSRVSIPSAEFSTLDATGRVYLDEAYARSRAHTSVN
jgi:hypothetical protein